MAGAVDPNKQSSFGRMFPTLDADPGRAGFQGFTPTDQALTDLVQTQGTRAWPSSTTTVCRPGSPTWGSSSTMT